MLYRRILAFLLCISFIALSPAFSQLSYGEEIGPGINMKPLESTDGTGENTNGGAAAAVTSQTGAKPGSVPVKEFPADLDLDAAVANAGLLELGENNIPPDPILDSTPWVHYRLMDISNTPLVMTESLQNQYLYLKEGFSRLYLAHNSKTPTDRYYYRAYTTKQGWFPWSNSDQPTPNHDNNDKIQAIQIRMKGYVANRADIYYKVVLNDGTVLDWAKNGQTTGSIGSDRYIVALKITLWNKEIPFPGKTSVLTQSEHYDGMYVDENGQVQYSTANGAAYSGWVYHGNDQYYFKDGVKLTSWQYIDGYKYLFGEDGKLDKDLEDNLGLTGDYMIKYNKSSRTMYVMAKDGANGYIIPYKTFMSSAGPDTPLGTFRTYVKYRWKFMHDNIYCQFLTRFNGPFLMHSIIYENQPTSYHLDSATYNGIEVAQSGGCIRLLSKDASWIYHNVPLKTAVHIYYDPWNKGPVEKDAIEVPIPREQTFDPTDPVIVQQQQAEEAAAAALAAQQAIQEAQSGGSAEDTNNGAAVY